MKDLKEALSSMRAGLVILEAKYPIISRSGTVTRKVMAEVNCYQIMLGQKQKFTKQTKRDLFFKMKTDMVLEDGSMSEEGERGEEGERWGRRAE